MFKQHNNDVSGRLNIHCRLRLFMDLAQRISIKPTANRQMDPENGIV